MNPLLAAIDLQEALPRVVHDPDRKYIAEYKQKEHFFFFYIGWYD